MIKRQMNHQELFTVHPESNEPNWFGFAAKLGHVCSRFVESIINVDTLNRSTAQHKPDETVWTAYDQFTGRRVYFNSEAAMRGWLDRHYLTQQGMMRIRQDLI